MANNTDTERLDAIGNLGLAVTRHDQWIRGMWEETWHCQQGQSVFIGASIREVIDEAISEHKKQMN